MVKTVLISVLFLNALGKPQLTDQPYEQGTIWARVSVHDDTISLLGLQHLQRALISSF